MTGWSGARSAAIVPGAKLGKMAADGLIEA
jgi:hypothetical protein